MPVTVERDRACAAHCVGVGKWLNFFFFGGGGAGLEGLAGGRCQAVCGLGCGQALQPPRVHAAMRRFAMKNLQPNHVPYCATSPLKRAAFCGTAKSGAEQIIIFYFDIIITSLENRYYTLLHHFYIYYYPF